MELVGGAGGAGVRGLIDFNRGTVLQVANYETLIGNFTPSWPEFALFTLRFRLDWTSFDLGRQMMECKYKDFGSYYALCLFLRVRCSVFSL